MASSPPREKEKKRRRIIHKESLTTATASTESKRPKTDSPQQVQIYSILPWIKKRSWSSKILLIVSKTLTIKLHGLVATSQRICLMTIISGNSSESTDIPCLCQFQGTNLFLFTIWINICR